MDDEQQPVEDELLQVPGDMVGALEGGGVIFSTAGGGSTIFQSVKNGKIHSEMGESSTPSHWKMIVFPIISWFLINHQRNGRLVGGLELFGF